MKAKLKSAIIASSAVAMGLVGGLAPQVTESVQTINKQVVTKTVKRQVQNQSPANRVINNVQSLSINRFYLPYGSNHDYYLYYTMSPKEFGIHLLRSGKNKYNNRLRKHIQTMRS